MDESRAPETIAEAVELINRLPPPVDIACFLESLPRPLHVHASASTFSAQPSYGPEDPRVFVFSGDLIMSVVSAGTGANLLEFGEFVDETHTIKGELEMPPVLPLPASAPHDHIFLENRTTCGTCHRDEVLVGPPANRAFSSIAYRPTEDHRLDIDEVVAAYASCDVAETPERCAMLTALYGHGEVIHRDFPENLATFE